MTATLHMLPNAQPWSSRFCLEVASHFILTTLTPRTPHIHSCALVGPEAANSGITLLLFIVNLSSSLSNNHGATRFSIPFENLVAGEDCH
jgi:hypothetical protein